MANVSTYIKIKNIGGSFDTVFPISKAANIVVDDQDKRLSTTLTEIETALTTFVTLDSKGQPNGVATLDVNGVIPLAQLPAQVKEVRVVDDIATRDLIDPKFSSLSVYVKNATADTTVASGGAFYLYDGTTWVKTAEAESMDVVLQWANIQGTPTTLAGYGITDAVNASEVTETATANKLLKLNAEGKLVANVVGDVEGNAASATKLANSRTLSISGDGTGSASFDGSDNADISFTLADSGVTAGTYTKVIVDGKGRVTTGDNLVASDIPNLDWSKITTGKPTTLAGYGITDALAINGGTLTGYLTLNADPTENYHAVTKQYVDFAVQGLSVKPSVRVATVSNITLSGAQVIDGVTLVVGDRVLVKDQTNGVENGIYVVSESSWARSLDFDGNPITEVKSGEFVFVQEGSVNADSGFVLVTNAPLLL